MKKFLLILSLLMSVATVWSQAPGTTPVKVSQEKQMVHGRKYYVHIVEKGQTVYSIAKAYRVQSFDAVTHVDIHSLHPGDTVWIPFRGQLAEIEEQATPMPTPTPAAAPAPTTPKVEVVHVHDTVYMEVHDTSYVKVPYAVHDTMYINVPYAVHDTTVVTKTVTKTEYVTVHDTTYITVHDTAYVDAPYAVHDTTVVTNTVTKTEYVTVHDTAYITVHDTAYVDAPYAVHDTAIVTNTVTKTEYVPVHDTTYITVHDTAYIEAPYAVHDTAVVTNTVTKTECVTVHDTTYITVHDTAYIAAPYAVHDTAIVTNTVTKTEYVPVHDTTYITVHDTAYVDVPYAVHDTAVVTNTVTKTEYVPVHDTTYITVHDTAYVEAPYAVHDTAIVTNTVTKTEFVTVHDTTYIAVRDTMVVTDTVTVTKTEYVPVHDTTYVTVHDTAIVTNTEKLTEYVPVHDTAYIAVRDTIFVTDTVTLTKYVSVHDTTYIAVHDTTFVVDTVDFAFASASAVALPEYVPTSQPATSADGPTTERSQRQVGKTLKIALMMPLYLSQMDQISTSKFDIEQRGKKSYRQFEFIEFYEGVLLALDRLAEDGINVELNVVDVSDNTPAKVEEAFRTHHVEKSDFVVALLLRDAFDKAAELAQQAGVYIVNPMATRSELCLENPYMVKIQPSVAGMVKLMLNNMKAERPDAHLYIIHSNASAEKPVMEEVKKQLDERGDIPYTIFNWSQSAKLTSVLKKTPSCHVLSIYDQNRDNNRVFVGNLLNKLAAFKTQPPVLYSFTDWTKEYIDVDFAQLQQLNYHTYSMSWDMTNEVHMAFLRAYRNRFNTEPSSPLAATGYDLMLYIVTGLNGKSSAFWQSPTLTAPGLIQPLHLSRHGAGLENDRAQLYRMEGLRLLKATMK